MFDVLWVEMFLHYDELIAMFALVLLIFPQWLFDIYFIYSMCVSCASNKISFI